MKKITTASILGLSVSQAEELLQRLTARELQVADLMSTGMKNARIAEQLNLSPKTLDFHRLKLKKKLKVDTPVSVARIVLAKKLGELV